MAKRIAKLEKFPYQRHAVTFRNMLTIIFEDGNVRIKSEPDSEIEVMLAVLSFNIHHLSLSILH